MIACVRILNAWNGMGTYAERIMKRLLNRHGLDAYVVSARFEGDALIAHALSSKFDVVMIESGGQTDSIERLRNAGVQTSILNLTGHGERSRLLGLEAGADASLELPFEADVLVDTLIQLTRRTRALTGFNAPDQTTGSL